MRKFSKASLLSAWKSRTWRGEDEDPELFQRETAIEDGGGDGTGRVDGAVGHRNGGEVDEGEGEADGQTAESCGSLGRGGTEDHHQEDEGHHDFHHHTLTDVEHAEFKRVDLVAGQAFGGAEDEGEDTDADEGTDDLEEDVEDGVLAGNLAGHPHAEGDGGIDVATRDGSDGVGHHQDGETEGEGDAQKPDSEDSKGAGAGKYGATATHQYQNHGTNHFCKILFHNILNFKWLIVPFQKMRLQRYGNFMRNAKKT